MADPQGSPDVVSDREKTLAHEPEMATRLTAAEGRAFGKEMEGCADVDPMQRAAEGLDGVDAEPEAGPREAADIGDGLLDEPGQFGPRTLA
ncbi:hypothetical protein [Tautonia rosea]|uniref:hypothetical protein n=1 Tax=Tautonia rosea TaxID=2728037 RepID=UPI001475025C|nr:hypothetical protein [Tautonia rosea]